MADYYPLISRAVAGLDKNTGELRRALYERARTALVDQLRGVTPALNESEITRERLALEEAIRKVETEEAKRIRQEAPRAADRRPAQTQDIAYSEAEPDNPRGPLPPPHSPVTPVVGTAGEPKWPTEPGRSADSAQIRRPSRIRPPDAKVAAPDDAIGNAGDNFGDTDNPDDPALQAAKEAREAYLAAPASASRPDRQESRGEGESRRPVARRRGPQRPPTARDETGLEPDVPADLPPHGSSSGARSLERPLLPDSVRSAAAQARRTLDEEDDGQPLSRRFLTSVVRLAIAVVLIAIVGATAYWQRHNLLSAVRSVATLTRAPAPQPPSDSSTQRSKIPDRIGQREGASPGTPAAPQSQVEAPVAQRVVLYEEDPNDSAGKRYVGTVVWRTEPTSAGPGQTPDVSVRGDITIPERNMSVTWSLSRNTDKDLPASHTVSIMFTLPADFSHGGISEIRGVLMKQAEQTRGVSLTGLSVKVTTGFFLVGLSATDTDVQRNIQLLKERSWFDIAIVYNDGRRAILAVEKGTPGDRAFADAFAAWGQ